MPAKIRGRLPMRSDNLPRLRIPSAKPAKYTLDESCAKLPLRPKSLAKVGSDVVHMVSVVWDNAKKHSNSHTGIGPILCIFYYRSPLTCADFRR